MGTEAPLASGVPMGQASTQLGAGQAGVSGWHRVGAFPEVDASPGTSAQGSSFNRHSARPSALNLPLSTHKGLLVDKEGGCSCCCSLFGLAEGLSPSGAPGLPPALDLAAAEPGHRRAALLDASLLLYAVCPLSLPRFGFMTVLNHPIFFNGLFLFHQLPHCCFSSRTRGPVRNSEQALSAGRTELWPGRAWTCNRLTSLPPRPSDPHSPQIAHLHVPALCWAHSLFPSRSKSPTHITFASNCLCNILNILLVRQVKFPASASAEAFSVSPTITTSRNLHLRRLKPLSFHSPPTSALPAAPPLRCPAELPR